jgi:hypothetical protein
MSEFLSPAEANRESLNLRKTLEQTLSKEGKVRNNNVLDLFLLRSPERYLVKDTGIREGSWRERVLIRTIGGLTKPENAPYILVGNGWVSDDKKEPVNSIATFRIGKAPGNIEKLGRVAFQDGEAVYNFKTVEQAELGEALAEIKNILEKVRLI